MKDGKQATYRKKVNDNAILYVISITQRYHSEVLLINLDFNSYPLNYLYHVVHDSALWLHTDYG
jgi:hypothetical protein